MSSPSFISLIQAVVWDETGIVDQSNLITAYIQVRNSIPIQESAHIELEFQRKLSITRDEWFRILASKESERVRILQARWQKAKPPVSLPPLGVSGFHPPSVYPKSGWLGEFVYSYGKEMESPDSFLFWSGVATLSSVIRRKISIKFGIYDIFPNFYVILVSKQGESRKGPAIKSAMKMSRSLSDINFIDRTSTERLPHDLSYRVQNIGGSTTKVPCDAIGFLCAEELVTILDDQNYNIGIIKFLIDWWDCPERRGVRTLKHGIIELKNIFITLLGGTTPTLMQESLSHIVIGGGMLSRTIFVVEERTPKISSWPEPPDSACEQRLLQALSFIDTMQGQFEVPKESLEWMDIWYRKFRSHIQDNEALAASIERKQMHLLKLSIILGVSNNLPMILTTDLLSQASAILDEVEKKMPEAAKVLQTTPQGRDNVRILEQIRKAGPNGITRVDIQRKNSPYGVDKSKLDGIIDTLIDQDDIEVDWQGAKRVYKSKGGKP